MRFAQNFENSQVLRPGCVDCTVFGAAAGVGAVVVGAEAVGVEVVRAVVVGEAAVGRTGAVVAKQIAGPGVVAVGINGLSRGAGPGRNAVRTYRPRYGYVLRCLTKQRFGDAWRVKCAYRNPASGLLQVLDRSRAAWRCAQRRCWAARY